ncbi:MAG: M6 family metalloprotease domain-containing protein [Gammaproteobacteria bacterium]|nr:M6 family metalloprotease domain-containing protein [Gammaproteobacteria bacterium]
MKTLTLFAAFALVFTLKPVYAVPHLNGGAEPFFFSRLMPHTTHSDGVTGIHSRALLTKASVSLPVEAIVIRVQFVADANTSTTGDGTWLDASYAADVGGDSNYWINKNLTALSDYYAEVSYNALQLNLTLAPTIYSLAHGMAYYGQETPASIESLIYDTVTAAVADVDFSAYDVVFIVHAGPGQETDSAGDSASDIWSLYYHDASISQQDSSSNPTLSVILANGEVIDRALIMPQTGSQDGLTVDPLGLFAHEFGHWLGLPDLYATSVLFSPSWDGIGNWGLMGYGTYLNVTSDPIGSSPAHPSAWSKVYLGWVDPLVLDPDTDPGSLNLSAAAANAAVVKVPNSEDGTVYYLLENRQQRDFDVGLPGAGLLVWSIDENAISDGFGANRVNSWPSRPGVKLVEADNDEALLDYEDADQGSGSDPFPGLTANTAFTPSTTPSSANTSGGWFHLTDISQQPDESIQYSAGFSPRVPSGIEEVLSPNWMFRIRWTASTASDLSHYQIYVADSLYSTTRSNEFRGLTGMHKQDIQISAVDLGGRESAVSQSLTSQDLRCFIATAAHGSAMAPQVQWLREFRDRYLISHSLGRELVAIYYRYSPPLAERIARYETARAGVRVLLAPLIALAWLSVQLGLMDAVMLMLMAVVGMWMAGQRLRQRYARIIATQ